MDKAVPSGEPRHSGQPSGTALETGSRPAGPGQGADVQADFTQSIALVEAVAQVETELAATLHAMARQGNGTAAQRRLELAEDAVQGARTAGRLSESLRQQALRWAEHPNVAAPRRELDTGAMPVAAQNGPSLESVLDQRLADIDRRLAELRLARRDPRPGGDRPPRPPRPAQWRVQEAARHQQESAAHLLRAQDLAIQAYSRAAAVHDRTAQANARSAAAGIGDVAEHQRMAESHRAAAEADREKAQQLRGQLPDPGTRTG